MNLFKIREDIARSIDDCGVGRIGNYTDEAVDYYGDLFVAIRIGERGLTFEEFMHDPQGILYELTHSDDDYLPLLPQQLSVQRRMDYEEQQRELEQPHLGRVLELHGDRLMTPMHHRDNPKGWKTGRAQA